MKNKLLSICIISLFCFCGVCSAKTINVMLITGQTDKYHNWEIMSACLTDILAEQPIFNTDVVVMPSSGEFNPDFASYDVVVLNLNFVEWSDQTKRAFESYVSDGGGVVIIHETNNAFPEWKEFNRMIGLGGWGGRTEKDGDYYYWKDGDYVRDSSAGKTGSHGRRVPFEINVRNTKHPIMKGLPTKWVHNNDELYSNLRGPAENIEVLATAYSDPKTKGSGKEEPVFFTVTYGKGRIFHNILGHTKKDFTAAVRDNRGFQVVVSRGTEWAATGKVKQKNDMNF